MRFFTAYDRHPTIACPLGGIETPIYSEQLVDGVYRLVKSGVHNISAYVQASLEDTLIYNILDRFVKGDISALMHRKGQFLDVTGMPSTLAEAQQLMINASEKFEKLPDDIKAKFHYDVSEYVSRVAVANGDELLSIFGKDNSDTSVKDGDESVAE